MWPRRKGVVSKNSRKVVKTRKGYDDIPVFGATDATTRKLHLDTRWVNAADGSKYEIPFDPKTETVPDAVLFARLLDVEQGDRKGRTRSAAKDIGIDADIIHRKPQGGWTPEKIVEIGWWQHPNECDLVGIDDTGAGELATIIAEASKTAQNVGKQLVMLMPEESASRVRRILARNFNASELKKAVKASGVIIMEGNPGRGAAGCYIHPYEYSSVKTPIIILRPGWNEGTLTHEFIHHLRMSDVTRGGLTRSPLKFNGKGELVSSSKYESNKEYNACHNLEEACTVAESYVRAYEIVNPSGYYAKTTAHGDNLFERSEHDRKILQPDSKPLKGRKAEKRTSDEFDKTSISHLEYFRPGKNAIGQFNDMKAKGTVPKAEKPKKKPKAPKIEDASATTKGASLETATANRSAPKKKSTKVQNQNRRYTRATR